MNYGQSKTLPLAQSLNQKLINAYLQMNVLQCLHLT